MICERCGGLEVVEHFYGTATDVSAWEYGGRRCVNCGSIIQRSRCGRDDSARLRGYLRS
jgi:hypothetical protein